MISRFTKSYWQRFRTAEHNSCEIGVASTKQFAEAYKAEGYTKVPRDVALRTMTLRGAPDDPVKIDLWIDGHPSTRDRFQVARLLKRPHRSTFENEGRRLSL